MADRLGFIGLGNIGAPMARHLVDWEGGLTVFDLRDEAMAPFVDAGAGAATSVREVGERSDIVSLMVLDDAQVTSVTEELLEVLAPGSVILVHSTIRPGTAEQLAEQAAAGGVQVADAPVSGGFIGAGEGNLAIMFGGSEEAYERCKAPLRCMGGLVQRFGPVGAGTRAKIARNLLNFVGFAAAGEAQRLADAAGVDLRRLGRVVRHSDGITGGPSAVFLRQHAVPFADDDPLRGAMEHTLVLGTKDLELAAELARDLGVDVPFTDLALGRLGLELGVTDTLPDT